MSLKDHLIKLGSEKPELRDHLRPILDHLHKRAGTRSEIMEIFDINERGPDTLGPFERDGRFFDSLMDAVSSFFEGKYKNVSRSDLPSPKEEVKSVVRNKQMKASPQVIRQVGKLVEDVRKEFYGE